MNRGVGFWFWTLICVVGGVLFMSALVTENSYSGSSIELTANSNWEITIEAEEASLEAASSSYFALSRSSGGNVAGERSPKPLGWDTPEYFTASAENVQGHWIVEDGTTITLAISGEELTVHAVMKSEQVIAMRILIGIVAFLVWVVILAVNS